jgi:drug/metabolite transporter (DMT)-like permease
LKASLRSHLLLLLITIIAGGNYTVLKTLVPDVITANGLILLRAMCGTVFFYFLEKWMAPEGTVIERKDYLAVFLSGLFGVTLNQIFFYNGMSITTPINGSIFNLINPITIVIFSALMLGHKIGKYTIVGIILCFAGALLLLDIGNFSVTSSTFWGDIMVFINAIFFGLYVVISIPLVKKYNPYVIIKWNFLTAFILLLPLGFNDLTSVLWSSFTELNWASLIYTILLTTLLSYFLNYYLAGNTPPATIALYVYFQPFIAAIVAVLAGRDELTMLKVICGILIITGIFIAQKNKTDARATIE